MKLVEPRFEIIEEKIPTKKTELVGRTCYKSEALITKDSHIKFTEMILKRNHLAMIEHSTVKLQVDESIFCDVISVCNFHRTYLRFSNEDNRFLISGNFRSFRELAEYSNTNNIDQLICFLCECYPIMMKDIVYKDILYTHPINIIIDNCIFSNKELFIHESVSVRFINVPRGLTHELVRMRPVSYAQQSSRYCNFTKSKFGGHIKFVESPINLTEEQAILIKGCYEFAEKNYNQLIATGLKPQIARDILPIGLSSEIVATADLEEWYHILKLRTHPSAHPIMHVVMRPLLKEFKKRYPNLFGDLPEF